MSTPRSAVPVLVVLAAIAIGAPSGAQQPQPAAAAPSLPPLFFKEEWQQRARPSDAPADFVLEGGVTAIGVWQTPVQRFGGSVGCPFGTFCGGGF